MVNVSAYHPEILSSSLIEEFDMNDLSVLLLSVVQVTSTAGRLTSQPSTTTTTTTTTKSHQPAQGSVTPTQELEPASQEHGSKHERIKAFVKQSNQHLEQRQFTHGIPSSGSSGGYGVEHDGGYANYAHPPPPPPPPAHSGQMVSMHYAPIPSSKPMYSSQSQLQQAGSHHHHHRHYTHHPASSSSSARPTSVHGAPKERPRSQVWPGQGQVHPVQGHPGQGQSAGDLKAFQQQQMKGKKFVGLNGEFEVVGVV
jgi:hypothetical protein